MSYVWDKSEGKYTLYIPELRCTLYVFQKDEKWRGIGKFDYATDRKKFLMEEISDTPNDAKNLLVGRLLTGLFDCQRNLTATIVDTLD